MHALIKDIRPYLKGKDIIPALDGIETTGSYRWWFKEKCISILSLTDSDSRLLLQKKYNGITYYALYYGIAVKETIRKRLDWHINQIHKESNIKSGYISTLRLTLGALLLHSMTIKDPSESTKCVNAFIDNNCIVEWIPYLENEKTRIVSDETIELAKEYWYPLNIAKNHSSNKVKTYTQELKRLRKRFIIEMLNTIEKKQP